MANANKDLQLYTMYNDGKPIAYAYGEPWVAMALMVNDMQYPTPEAAKEAWEAMQREEANDEHINKEHGDAGVL